MKIKLMLATVAVVLVGLVGTAEAVPMPTGPGSCTPMSYCKYQWHCGYDSRTQQYLGLCTSMSSCLCY